MARRVAAGEEMDMPGFDLDAWNAAHVAERADWPVERVLDDLEAAHLETLAFLAELDGEKLAISGSRPALGTVTVGQALRVIAVHDGLHRRDIVGLLAEMSGG